MPQNCRQTLLLIMNVKKGNVFKNDFLYNNHLEILHVLYFSTHVLVIPMAMPDSENNSYFLCLFLFIQHCLFTVSPSLTYMQHALDQIYISSMAL